jgi:hypothetical protein
MKAYLKLNDSELGNFYVMIPKIREISKGLGNVIITYDNGDKHSIFFNDCEKAMAEIAEQIDAFYQSQK